MKLGKNGNEIGKEMGMKLGKNGNEIRKKMGMKLGKETKIGIKLETMKKWE